MRLRQKLRRLSCEWAGKPELGLPVLPFYPFFGEATEKVGTLILTSLLEDLDRLHGLFADYFQSPEISSSCKDASKRCKDACHKIPEIDQQCRGMYQARLRLTQQ